MGDVVVRSIRCSVDHDRQGCRNGTGHLCWQKLRREDYVQPSTPWYLDPNFITAIVTAIGVLAAIGTVAWQIQHARFIKGIEVLLEFEKRFESQMLPARKSIAQKLLATPPERSAEDVLNFYEVIGMLLRHRALEPTMVWHVFGTLCIVYVDAAKTEIEAETELDPGAWSEAKYLSERMKKLEEKSRKGGAARILARRKEYLSAEASAVLAPGASA
jgi:hypothetical protein